jgi:hypothetical protein
MKTQVKLTRPLPERYEIVTGPNGTESVAALDEPGMFYSAAAWAEIEKGQGLWKDAHRAIFREERADDARIVDAIDRGDFFAAAVAQSRRRARLASVPRGPSRRTTMWGVWCECWGGVTGNREAWLKSHGTIAQFATRQEAETEAARLNTRANGNPNRTADFRYTAREF